MPGMDPNFVQYFLRLIFALLIGSLIGLERESKGKPAGMRTNMLMCMGSCLIMILSVEVASKGPNTADPGRIAAQVITGIGFLGAGTIIRSRVSVVGLTTAATLWFVAALGLVIGYGRFDLAAVTAVLIVLTLTAIGRLEDRLETKEGLHVLRLLIHGGPDVLKRFKAILADHKITPESIKLEKRDQTVHINMEYIVSPSKHDSFTEAIRATEGTEILLDF
jgi:putative Mg2+ transporter-C (MgtC) family protein